MPGYRSLDTVERDSTPFAVQMGSLYFVINTLRTAGGNRLSHNRLRPDNQLWTDVAEMSFKLSESFGTRRRFWGSRTPLK